MIPQERNQLLSLELHQCLVNASKEIAFEWLRQVSQDARVVAINAPRAVVLSLVYR